MLSAIDPALERACGIVARKDAQPLRRALFRRKAAGTPAIRAALATWARLRSTRARAAFVAGFAAKCFLEVEVPTADAPAWSIAAYPNEARQLAALSALEPGISIAKVTLTRRPVPDRIAWAAAMRRVRELSAAWDLLERYARGGDFLVAARVASTVGYYLRMAPALERSRARAVIVSSDTNPYAVALTQAAARLGRRTCFVNHGHVASDPPPLDFDLSILDGPILERVYAAAGPTRGRIVFRGAEGIVRPMDTARLRRGVRRLGIFLSILVDWPSVARAIARLRATFEPSRIVLRLHPNREMRDPDWAGHLDLRGVTVSDGERALEDDASDCELVACGNSSAHLSVLKLGVPTIYVRGLDEVDDDYYRFVEHGITWRLPDAGGTRDAIAAFYEDPRWPTRFAGFDAGYPDRQADCDRTVASALRDLIGAS
jgi:hypothetical protein